MILPFILRTDSGISLRRVDLALKASPRRGLAAVTTSVGAFSVSCLSCSVNIISHLLKATVDLEKFVR